MKKQTHSLYGISQLLLVFILLFQITGCAPSFIPVTSDTTPPKVDLWYGDHQVFGALGLPQKWINILGNIADAESGIREASYAINDGPAVRMKLGPDNRRLLKPGDFNVEIDASLLHEGQNFVGINAANRNGLTTAALVTVELYRKTWPLPYHLDWSQVTRPQEALQIVDGKWRWDKTGIRPVEVGYDRVLAIGDMNWTSYEVILQVTLHGIDPQVFNIPKDPGAGFGINLHWLGHSDDPVKCDWPAQPHCGWEPTGASNWYGFEENGKDWLSIQAGATESQYPTILYKLQFGHTYIFKARTITGQEGNEYFLKVWEPSAEREPAAWTLTQTASLGYGGQKNLGSGSFLIVLHRVDATVGDIRVTGVKE